MKKMSVKATQQANGGRWKCKYCGKKTTIWATMHWHQETAHWYDVIYNGYKYSWCW